MNRRQLEHVVDEIARRFELDYFYIVGASAALAQISEPSLALQFTRDVDVIPNLGTDQEVQDMADRIDFVIGEGSEFDSEHGYYAQGVDFRTPQFAPAGWQDRCVPIRVVGTTALCMELHDLALAKLGAGREKDREYVEVLVQDRLVDADVLLKRLAEVVTTDEHRRRMEQLLGAMVP